MTKTYLVDTKLPFGARLSMEAFHRLSRAIQRMLHKRGISVIIYLDDILIVAPSHQACQSAMQQAISILRELGFAIAYNKLEGPTQQLTFLGIFISAVTQTLHLPSGKVAELLQLLRIFRCKKCASLKQLQRLAGKLAWAANVCEAVEFTCNTSMILCALSNTASTKSASTLNFMLIWNSGGATLGDFQWCYWNWQYDWKLNHQQFSCREINSIKISQGPMS